MKRNLDRLTCRFTPVAALLAAMLVAPAFLLAQTTVAGLPEAVTGTQPHLPFTGPTGPTYSTFTVVTPVGGSPLSAPNTYNVWCFNPYGYIQGIPESYTAYSSYYLNFLALSGVGTSPATDWQEINWLLNHKKGESGTLNPSVTDIEYVIDDILVPGYDTADLSPDGKQLLSDAEQYGPEFTPGPGQILAIALYNAGINPNDGATSVQDLIVEYTLPCPPGKPGLKIVKKASVTTAKCTDQVTYSYTVTNTGTVTLTNIVVTDDNGTPNYPGDDFTVGTIASLAAGASVTLTKTIFLPVTESAVDSAGNVTNHTLIKQVLPTGDIQVTLLEDTNLADNTFGFSASPDWTNGSSLWDRIGQDSAEFQLTDGKGNVVLDFAADYISLAWGAPLGLATGGVNNGAGQMYVGNSANIGSITTTLSDSLNRPVSDWGFLLNAPPPSYSNNSNPWKFQCGYTVVIKKGCFGNNGFGDCKVKQIQHNKCKLGNNYQCQPTPVCTKVTNTATATVVYQGTTLTAMAQATVQETNGNGQCNTQPPPKCQPKPTCPQTWLQKCGQQWKQCGQWW